MDNGLAGCTSGRCRIANFGFRVTALPERTLGVKRNFSFRHFHSDMRNKAPHRRATRNVETALHSAKHRNMSTHLRDLGKKGEGAGVRVSAEFDTAQRNLYILRLSV